MDLPDLPPVPPGMFWRLEGKIAVPVKDMADMLLHGAQMGTQVAFTEIAPFEVSTVFLTVAHNRREGHDPMLFETMVFADGEAEGEVYCRRYFTWDEAEKGHEVACAWARAKIEEINGRLSTTEFCRDNPPGDLDGVGDTDRLPGDRSDKPV